MKSLIQSNKKRARSGYTLLELTFSIAFFSAIVLTAVAGFIGIFNAYNRAQGLTRTQFQVRTAMDSIVGDLRNTQSITEYPKADSSTSPAKTDPLAADTRNFFCLNGEGFSRGYASLYIASTNHYHLVRMPNCTTITGYELLIGPDVWFNTVTDSGNRDPLITGVNAPLQITQVGSNATPAVWSVRVSGHRGLRIPGATDQASLSDPLSAETVLETIVTTRK